MRKHAEELQAPRERHVETTRITYEARATLASSDCGKQHHVIFTALHRVNRVDENRSEGGFTE
jgi:hypothetical protein